MEAALGADDYAAREDALVTAYGLVARRHNELGVTAVVDPEVRRFHGRPYRVLMADRFVDACLTRLDDSELRHIPLVGSVDQLADSTDLLSHGQRPRKLAPLYET